MSLLSKFEEVKTSIVKANDIAELLLNGEPPFSHENQWYTCTFAKAIGRNYPNKSHIAGMTPKNVKYRSLTTRGGDWGFGDGFIGYLECWVLTSEAFTLSTSMCTDDEGRLYLNDVSIATCASTKTVNVSIPFIKGINHLEIIYSEDGGDAYGYLNHSIYTDSRVKGAYGKRGGY